MTASISRGRRRSTPSLSLVSFVLLLALLALAGGASREDALGQGVVRAGASALLAVWVLAGGRVATSVKVPAILLGFAAALIAAQLVPLPPSLWTSLHGRAVFESAAALSGQSQPWRPTAIVPDAAWNALFSLVVPFAALLFAGGCEPEEQPHLLLALLVLIICSALAALAQFSGGAIVNPLINARLDGASGLFANRNHQALFLAIGCVAAPAWAFSSKHAAPWREWAALGCVVLLFLTILATGSRAGLLLGALALITAVALVAGRVRGRLKRAPRWVWPAMLSAGAAAVVALAAISVGAGRAESLRRLADLDPGTDMRARGLPVVLRMFGDFFPFGSGFGGFEPLFRLYEPLGLLKPTYFNHAHNDWLEIALGGGLPALACLLAAVAWWLTRSFRAWRDQTARMPRLGSAVILLILVASAFDYPARTPLIMTTLVLAAIWLGGAARRDGAGAR